MKYLVVGAVLLSGCFRSGYEPEPCALDPQAAYSYRVIPDGREQGPNTLAGFLGAEESEVSYSCHGERLTLDWNGAQFKFQVLDTQADGAMVVHFTLDGIEAQENILMWEQE